MSNKTTDNIKDFQLHTKDTGSTPVQLVQLTERINYLTQHFNSHPKDKNSKKGFFTLISRRKKLLKYFSKNNQENYSKLISALGLRK